MKIRRPAFQFYPADWRKDAALQSCSVAAQGLWINIMCIAHECEPYGHLTVNGKPMQAAQLCRLVGLTPKECQRFLDELEAAGVFSKRPDGAIFSRRMLRDHQLAEYRAECGELGGEHGIKGKEHGQKGAEHGKRGGRPKSGKGGDKNPDNPPLTSENNPPLADKKTPPPSSSSSSSPSGDESPSPLWANGEHPFFAEFWKAYPHKARRVEAARAFAEIDPDSVLLAKMLAAVDAQKQWPKWTDQGGKFVPFPAKWLELKAWDDQQPERLAPTQSTVIYDQ